jgi:hypothetical protein
MWLSDEKPVYQVFFEKSLQKLMEVIESGFQLNSKCKIKVRVQAFIADLPAKAAALNIKQFNGEFGCIKCLHPGEYNRSFHKMTYPPNVEADVRDAKSFREAAILADRSKETIYGIRGLSSFSKVLTLPDQVPFDYMHLILQGHAKWLINHYFLENQYDCYIGKKKQDFNELLKYHTIPHNLNRKFPSIQSNLKFKSTELKLFIFHLALPMLMHLLPADYWCLLFLYVYSTRVIYEPFSKSCLKTINAMIKLYHNSLNEYFGDGAYDYSIHAHLHLASQVFYHGPLHCHSQFVFEGALGNLKKRILGSRGFFTQTVRKIFFHSNPEALMVNTRFINSELFSLVESIENQSTQIKNGLLGPFVRRALNDDERRLFKDAKHQFDNTILTSTRCVLNHDVYHSTKYDRCGNSNSYTVCFEQINCERFGDIEEFYQFGKKLLCKVKIFDEKLECDFPNVPREFRNYVNIANFNKFFKCFEEEKYGYVLIDCKSIICKALKVQSSVDKFFSKLVYSFEHD